MLRAAVKGEDAAGGVCRDDGVRGDIEDCKQPLARGGQLRAGIGTRFVASLTLLTDHQLPRAVGRCAMQDDASIGGTYSTK
ncbi:MAG: hypothetical protein Kow0010_17620 [Dehalococcoidia bacterium]